MKKNILLLLIALVIVSFTNCNEDLNPYGDLKDKYILSCVLNADSTYQVATISHSYMIENPNPYLYTTDPGISGARVRISFADSAKVFIQDSVERDEQARYSNPAVFYYTNNLKPLPNTQYYIEAQLPNGRRLTGLTTTPSNVVFDWARSDSIIPMPNKNYTEVFWTPPREDLYVSSVFKIVYFIAGTGGQRYEKLVPVRYVKEGDENIPYFPEPSYRPKIYVEKEAFDIAMQEISEGDPNKTDYIILSFILELRIYDENLTNYFASTKEVADSFSLKVDETDYTNINGGLGIFGSYIRQRTAVRFSYDYIRSFNYTPGLTE